MNSTKASSILFTLGLILIISHAPLQTDAKKPPKASNLVGTLCKAALQDRAKCMQLMRSHPKILSSKDQTKLSKLILELAVNKSTKGQKFLRQLAEEKKSPAFEQCATTHYNKVVSSFKIALLEMEEDTQTANIDARVAGDAAYECEIGLNKEHVAYSPVCSLNKEIKLLSKLAFLATMRL